MTITPTQDDRALFAKLFGILPTSAPIDQRAMSAIAHHRQQAEEAERARIITWLEGYAERDHEDGLTYGAAVYAGMIAAGEHRK